MVNVIAWPPVGLTTWEFTRLDPIGRSSSMFTGRRRVSAAQRRRRAATATVPGIGPEQAGAGYVEMLKEQLDGGVNLVRVECRSAIWHLASQGFDRSAQLVDWTVGAVPLLWTSGGTDLVWFGGGGAEQRGVPETDGDWPSVRVTGFPPSRIVARPSERITIHDGEAMEAARVMRVARSDADGEALIRLNAAFTLSGVVSLGDTESFVFEALDMPRAVQPVQGDWAYQWDFREVFEDETAGFTEVNPWL